MDPKRIVRALDLQPNQTEGILKWKLCSQFMGHVKAGAHQLALEVTVCWLHIRAKHTRRFCDTEK
ncbi:rCG43929, isoform CRA_b [Rattus norvegicus]|uniref:RCG43929, isoform CRA_b n=1 Tax=Rattus norvegicus TaxID=10116 RepID=A6J7C2_RAT|nr:rCG43929, isoform CRA_b [Rattus norvegicus]